MINMTKEIINSNNMENYDNAFCAIGTLHEKDISMNVLYEYLSSLGYFKEIIKEEIGNVVAPYGCNDLCGISLVRKK